MGKPAARITDLTSHGTPLTPGPGSPNVFIGFLPAWRGIPLAAAAAVQAAQTAADTAMKAAEAATKAAAGTPGAPAALAAEQATKGALLASMSSLMSSFAGSSDIHVCPIPTPVPPHGPGVVIDGSSTVLINNMPACTMGCTVLEALGGPDKIAKGEPTVLIGDSGGGGGGGGGGGRMAKNMFQSALSALGDILGSAFESIRQALEDAWNRVTGHPTDAQWQQIEEAIGKTKTTLKAKRDALSRGDPATLAAFDEWFGRSDPADRKKVLDTLDKQLTLLDTLDRDSFRTANEKGTYAWVTPNDPDHKITLADSFWTAPVEGSNSRVGTLAHEMSHFDDIAGTDDVVYGESGARTLARNSPDDALNNADNFEYFVEDPR